VLQALNHQKYTEPIGYVVGMNCFRNSRCKMLLVEAVRYSYDGTRKSHNSGFITDMTGIGNGRIRTAVSLHSLLCMEVNGHHIIRAESAELHHTGELYHL